MPIITMPSPLTAASEALGQYAQERTRSTQQQIENERVKNQEAFEAQRMALEQRAADERHRMDEANIASQQMHDKITQEDHAYEVSQRPLAEQLVKLQLAGTQDANTLNHFKIIKAQGDAADDAYIRKLTGMGLTAAQAQAKLQETHARIQNYAVQQASAQARIAQGWAHVGIAEQGLGEHRRHDTAMEGVAGANLGLREQALGLSRERLGLEKERFGQQAQAGKLQRQLLQARVGALTGAKGAKLTPKQKLLQAKIQAIFKKNPGIDLQKVRAAAFEDGFSEDDVDLLLPHIGMGDTTMTGWGEP